MPMTFNTLVLCSHQNIAKQPSPGISADAWASRPRCLDLSSATGLPHVFFW